MLRVLGPVVAVLVLAVGCASLGNYYGPRAATVALEDVAYLDDGHPRHQLDLYLPKDIEGFSTVIFVHGGWWSEQDRRYFQPVVGLYGNIAVALANRGIAVANISYRLHPEASLDEMLDDVAAAVRFVHREIGARGGDDTSLFLSGHSAGGHLVSLLGAAPEELDRREVDPTWLRGVVALSAPLSVDNMYMHSSPEKVAGVLRPLFGDSEASRDRASPLAQMSGSSLPFLIVTGERDLRGILADYAAVTDSAEELGVNARFHQVPAATHGDIVLSIGGEDDQVTDVFATFVDDLGH